jgi:cellulose synthase/poly-beta-1,6-N-acetylglucosamine synthase-like glycosyltransferase
MTNFTVIIPFQKETPYLRQTLVHLADQTYRSFEVVLIPDEPLDPEFQTDYPFPIRATPSGPVSPAIKRDQGVEMATGQFLAFIDDDAYPASDWLSNLLPYFKDTAVAAVGGPQVTPPEDNFWQQVSGATFLSPLNGAAVERYWPGKTSKFVDDWPSVNLTVRRKDFLAVGGFDNAYWPGEDTKLSLDLVKQLGRKIVYAPNAVVYHHRRAGFFNHLRQIGNYGLHRGFFVKRFPETSRRLSYFIPSIFFLFVVSLPIALMIGGGIQTLYLSFWGLYAAAIGWSIVSIAGKVKHPGIALATLPFQIGTHIWYGWRFLKGLVLVKDLRSRLGR